MASPSLHALLLLSDSALPLGSFAFSSGLESFLCHNKASHTSSSSKLLAFDKFLVESLRNISSSSLPYVTCAYGHPQQLTGLDNDFDASIPCTVARRASVTQGRALLAVWERALASSAAVLDATSNVNMFAERFKAGSIDEFGMKLEAHFPPLFGAVCRALDLTEHDTAYLFLLNHAKAILSAAVRASVMGPYQSQAILAGSRLRSTVQDCISNDRGRPITEACVTAPTMDLWMGRHELLYSRIFNS